MAFLAVCWLRMHVGQVGMMGVVARSTARPGDAGPSRHAAEEHLKSPNPFGCLPRT